MSMHDIAIFDKIQRIGIIVKFGLDVRISLGEAERPENFLITGKTP